MRPRLRRVLAPSTSIATPIAVPFLAARVLAFRWPPRAFLHGLRVTRLGNVASERTHCPCASIASGPADAQGSEGLKASMATRLGRQRRKLHGPADAFHVDCAGGHADAPAFRVKRDLDRPGSLDAQPHPDNELLD